MLSSILKYYEVWRINLRSRIAYPVTLLARAATIAIRIWIFYALYAATYSLTNSNQIGGLNLAQVLWVLAITQSVQSATRPPAVSSLIEDEIKSGEFAYTVCRPYSYILFHLFSYLGRVIPMAIVCLLVTLVLVTLFVGTVQISFLGLCLGLLCLFLGMLLDFLMVFIVGIAALWVEETFGFYAVYQKLQMILGGQILPLSMFPAGLKNIAEFLPFANMYYCPALLIVAFEASTFFKLIAMQIFWIAVAALIACWLFGRGMKVVTANGG